jgi:NADH:ubiquinone oxidoreductase subunit E
MLVSEQERLKEDILRWTAAAGKGRNCLIPTLQAIQAKYHYISDHAMQIIADQLGIHPVEVYGVVTFYSFLDSAYKGKFTIRLCRTISCDMAGKDQVARQLENDLGIAFGETTPDGKFTLEWANCLGMCDQGPALLVNDQVYTRVTPDGVLEILDQCRKAFGVYAEQKEVH